jgi:integrase
MALFCLAAAATTTKYQWSIRESVMNVYKDFRAIFNWYRQEQDQPKVTWYAKQPKLLNLPPRWFTPEEVDLLVNAAIGQFKPFFRLAGASGLRFGELAGLRYEDIDFNRGLIEVKRSSPYSETTKTPAGFYRTVYLDALTLEMIRQHLDGRRAGLIFQPKFGTPLKSTDVNRHVLKPLCAKIGIKKGTCHSFRHGRISLMVAARLPDKFIQSQVGQVDKKITNHYTHFEDETNHAFINEALLRGQKSFRAQNTQTVN